MTFVITQSQADKRQALAQEQAYQQVLQNRTQLQQPPAPVYAPAPVTMTPAPTFKRNDVYESKADRSSPPAVDLPSSNNNPANQADGGQKQTQESQADITSQQVLQYYNDGVSAYRLAKSTANSDQGFMGGAAGIRDLSQYTNQIFSDSKAIRSLESTVSDERLRNLCETDAVKLDTMAQWTLMPAAYSPPY